MGTTEGFTWGSLLGVAVALLLVVSAAYVLIAIAGAVILHTYGVASPQNNGQFFLGPGVDAVWFGKPPAQVVAENPRIGQLVLLLMDALTGLMLGMGILLFGVVWFGLRTGQEWALWTAVAGNAGMLAFYWLLAMLPVLREFGVSYWSVFHPYALVPTVLVPVAAVAGWVGLHSAG